MVCTKGMSKNVIILTSGLSGSSVLTGLISRAGYWTGEGTHKKEDYDTHENQELIELNLNLFRQAGYKGNYLLEYSPEAIDRIAALHTGRTDTQRYADFVAKCNQHQPWIWKDPRLWMTIRFWKHYLPLDNCRFILLTRALMQSWVSATLRRQIRTYTAYRNYEERITESIVAFAAQNKLDHLHVRYEQLIQNPESTIRSLNGYLDTSLTVDALKKVYRKPLFKNPRPSLPDHAKAMMIYLKNYRVAVSGR